MSRHTRQDAVREKYGHIARSVGKTGCCGPTACGCGGPITSDLYSTLETAGIPADAVAVSLGCGNPTALIELQPGRDGPRSRFRRRHRRLALRETGGPTGKAYGLDMTDEMLALAGRTNARPGRRTSNFSRARSKRIPLPDQSVDVIISNCVINLSVDKDAVLREAFRVLKPNGRFAVSDVVFRGDVPAEVRRSMELWVGCIAGALRDDEYTSKLKAAGFVDVELDPWRVYQVEDARAFLSDAGVDVDRIAAHVEGKVVSAFIRARKPEAKSCCGPTCCS